MSSGAYGKWNGIGHFEGKKEGIGHTNCVETASDSSSVRGREKQEEKGEFNIHTFASSLLVQSFIVYSIFNFHNVLS